MLVKTSLVDFPGRVSCVLFTGGCNLRCPYCYNGELARGKIAGAGAVTAADVIAHLARRSNVLTGFVLSGGEPLLSPHAAALAAAARQLGYSVKLDTNGTLPGALGLFLCAPYAPDYVAMDIKTAPGRYALFLPDPDNPGAAAEGAALGRSVEQSVELLSRLLPPECREFRTVLAPGIAGEDDIREISRLLPKNAVWCFAPFKPGSCLDPAYDAVLPYTDKTMAKLTALARERIPGARLR